MKFFRQRRRVVPVIGGALLTLCLLAVGSSVSLAEIDWAGRSPSARITTARVTGSRFLNQDPAYSRGPLATRFGMILSGMTWLVVEHRVAALPIAVPDLGPRHAGSGLPTVTWIGHSTVLVQLDGVSFLTDPTWNTRSGPFGGRVGVSRYTPPGVRFEDLPQIDFVLISHDHYDHLDEPTVKRLAAAHNPRFIVPLGLKKWLADRGIQNAVELNWGESVSVKGLTVVCTPAQHGSGRTLADQGRRLWAAWAVLGSKRFYFGGDTGYYRHFKDTGDALGPFDLAALPIGSYTPRATAKPVHISPEEALQAWRDLRAAQFLGIHWGTFMLAREPYDEPPKRIAAEVERLQLPPERIRIVNPGPTSRGNRSTGGHLDLWRRQRNSVLCPMAYSV